MVRHLLTYPTWERYTVLAHVISNLTMREKRVVFQLLRQMSNVSPEVFFPEYGFTLSEFAVWYVLGANRRPSTVRADDGGTERAEEKNPTGEIHEDPRPSEA
jgi:hypothetical protein